MASEGFKPVYVLSGSDGFLQDHYRADIISRVVGQADPQTCIANFDGGDDPELAAVMDELRTLPFLAPARVVLVRNADSFISKNRQKLEEYVDNPCETSALVLIVSSFPGNTRLAKAVKKVGEIFNCKLPDASSLQQWLTKASGKRGKKIDPQSASMLEQWIGRNLAAQNAEIEKLCLYIGDRDTITPQDVSDVVTATAGPVAFALTNAITDGDTPGALKALDGTLKIRGAEFQALGTIAWHLRRALQAQQEIAATGKANLKMPYNQKNAFMGMLRRRSLAKLKADMKSLIDADLGMKSGQNPKSALQELVMALCS
ncbi:MAG: DNA polymerase III subunit delta [Phycisphaerales bacterium]|jgi:DNA polymerase III subunit delta|nr:DNA polymerase III subunit delta [Phycisphaerales bacterium]